MKTTSKIFIGVLVSSSLGVAAVVAAQPGGMGPGMMHGMMSGHGPGFGGAMGGPMAGSLQHDDATHADMSLVHELLVNHESIKRTVTNSANGIKTVTESDDPQVAQAIKAHVASMEKRLKEGRQFSMFSSTLPVIFKNKDKIQTRVEVTEKGVIVTQSSDDAAVVSALQAHAEEVSGLAREGMVAMMRSASANMPMMRQNARAGFGAGTERSSGSLSR